MAPAPTPADMMGDTMEMPVVPKRSKQMVTGRAKTPAGMKVTPKRRAARKMGPAPAPAPARGRAGGLVGRPNAE